MSTTKTQEFAEFVKWLTTHELNLNEHGPLLHAIVGIGGEAGELLDCIKKNFAYRQPLNRDNLQEELGDILHYVTAAANYCGWTLEDLIYNNMKKLSKRYPNGYSNKDAIERKDK